MNTKEAMEALLEGKKVTSSSWEKGQYIFLDEDGKIKDDENNYFHINNRTPYELYEEPKQIVVIEKWLCRNNGYFIAQGDKEYLESIYPLSKVKLLDTYEVEL